MCLRRIFGFVLMMCGSSLSGAIAELSFYVEKTQYNTESIMINDFGDG